MGVLIEFEYVCSNNSCKSISSSLILLSIMFEYNISLIVASASASASVSASASTFPKVLNSWQGKRWETVSTNPKYKFIQDCEAENRRFELRAALFRSIQAVTFRKHLEQYMQDDIKIEIVDQMGIPRTIGITPEFICNVPRVAKCMMIARNLDKIAFTSVFFSMQNTTHDAEQENSEDIEIMNWEATEESIEELKKQISILIQHGMFKKYLKYKNKYLSLKKQITL